LFGQCGINEELPHLFGAEVSENADGFVNISPQLPGDGPAAGLRYVFRPMANIGPLLSMAARTLVKRDDVIWDIGANVGLFSLAATVCAGDQGQVIAFEPDAWIAQLLRRTSRAQPIHNARITVVPVAVASEISLRSFSITVRSRASNALSEYGLTQMGGVKEQDLVSAFNLDWLLSNLPTSDIIKIDGEGAELEVQSNQVRPARNFMLSDSIAREIDMTWAIIAVIEILIREGGDNRDARAPSRTNQNPRNDRRPASSGKTM
jgi:FkbM family methyltransferase